MNQIEQCQIENNVDKDGNPTGGVAAGLGFNIEWQNGPLTDKSKANGAFVETIISVALERIKFYQNSKFSCRENALAITKLEEALHWLEHRTKNRITRGVEGTHTV